MNLEVPYLGLHDFFGQGSMLETNVVYQDSKACKGDLTLRASLAAEVAITTTTTLREAAVTTSGRIRTVPNVLGRNRDLDFDQRLYTSTPHLQLARLPYQPAPQAFKSFRSSCGEQSLGRSRSIPVQLGRRPSLSHSNSQGLCEG